MLEARLNKAGMFKKILESVKDLVEDANFECAPSGISLQAMDSSHVSLVSVHLRSEGFEQYRCDRVIPLGINMTSMSKILKCANNDDTLTIQAEDSGDKVGFTFESVKADRVSEFELKLLDINSDPLGIPDTEYDATIKMPSADFLKICRDLTIIGDTVLISVSKEGLKFSVSGDVGKGSINVQPTASVDESSETQTIIDFDEPVALTFALRYLNFFTKATSLAPQVTIKLSKEVPLVVEYEIEEMGFIRYYLAPKIEEDS